MKTGNLVAVGAMWMGDVRVPLFDPRLTHYFWQRNTQGRAHAQLLLVPDVLP